jgi:hypothetical protein
MLAQTRSGSRTPYGWEDGSSHESCGRGRESGGTERWNLCPQLCPGGRNESTRCEKGQPEVVLPTGLAMSGRLDSNQQPPETHSVLFVRGLGCKGCGPWHLRRPLPWNSTSRFQGFKAFLRVFLLKPARSLPRLPPSASSAPTCSMVQLTGSPVGGRVGGTRIAPTDEEGGTGVGAPEPCAFRRHLPGLVTPLQAVQENGPDVRSYQGQRLLFPQQQGSSRTAAKARG